MAILSFANEGNEVQKRQTIGRVTRLAAGRGSKPGCPTPMSHLSTHDLKIHLFISMNQYLLSDNHIPGTAGSTVWLVVFIPFIWEGLSPQLKGI